MAVANTLAYYDTSTMKAVKCFTVQAPEVYLVSMILLSVILPNAVTRQNVVLLSVVRLNVAPPAPYFLTKSEP